MTKNNTHYPTFEELEQTIFREVQETFSGVMKQVLEAYDEQIKQERDKKRFYYHDVRSMTVQTLFGEVEVKRAYYKDRETGKYVYLLDQYLKFEGIKGFSPLVEQASIELAVTSTSYRQASQTLEKLLGYAAISHETIRQHVLDVQALPKPKEPIQRPVLFVEVDGLYIKRQGKNKKGREEKIAAVHQGWEINGKRVKLKDKRHYVHRGSEPFWEGFESFLEETYNYDPTKHLLVINGDGASWITACREYFRGRAFFIIDRFHVARDIRRLFRDHPRYRAMKKALSKYDGEKLLVELNSAVGTLGNEKKEERLGELIKQLEQYPEALGDYREWLKEKGIAVEDLRPMGSAEATMSVFAKRLKNGRSWVEKGVSAMMTAMIAIMDKLPLQTMIGRVETWSQTKQDEPVRLPKRQRKTIKQAIEETRDNLSYLKQKAGIPMHDALKGLKGI